MPVQCVHESWKCRLHKVPNKGLLVPIKLKHWTEAIFHRTLSLLNLRFCLTMGSFLNGSFPDTQKLFWGRFKAWMEKGFHPLFHESDLGPLFHTLFYFHGLVWGRNLRPYWTTIAHFRYFIKNMKHPIIIVHLVRLPSCPSWPGPPWPQNGSNHKEGLDLSPCISDKVLNSGLFITEWTKGLNTIPPGMAGWIG